MKKTVLNIVSLFTVFCLSSYFSPFSSQCIEPEVKSLMDRVFSFERLAASYRMIRTVPVISGKLESSGTLELYSDGRLYWRGEYPDEYLFFTDGDDAYIEEDGKKSALPQAFSGIFSLVEGNSGGKPFYENDRMFSTSFITIDSERIGIEAVPSRGAMSSFISKIDIVVYSREAIVKEVNIIAANGSVTRIVFESVVRE
ncbi:MAG: outer membrane lipoprotein carrier protein LolA [Bacteroidetes bacterium]|uniref:Outer membrane lipoprotein carrier protein LolA n=1 Tax=Candidatus Merdivivens pullistercoris TaxID=2840873 RepID=A0A9D9N9M8_9BACT|nr:outer membrane lipoprotein carrier protein LolA [Candidatus Merdivivens pullistercoris]